MDIIPEVNLETIEFNVLTDDEIKELSVVTVTTHKQIENNKSPYPNGTYDARMGAQFDYPCMTCGNLVNKCPGHYGKIDLNWPLIAPLYAKLVIKWVKIICFRCRKIIFDVSIKELYGDFEEKTGNKNINDHYATVMDYMMSKLTSQKKKKYYCDHCNDIKGQIEKTGSTKNFQISYVQPDFQPSDIHNNFITVLKVPPTEKRKEYSKGSNFSDIDDVLYTPDILELFESVADEEIAKLGLSVKSHPRHYINRYFLVPPVNIRYINSIKKAIGSDNHVTSNIEAIIKENEKIGKGVNKKSAGFLGSGTNAYSTGKIAEIKNLIAAHNKYLGFNTEDKTNSIYESVKGKPGLIRQLLLGKILAKASRFIISCDTDMKPGTALIPRKYAKTMTVEEIVTKYNIDILRQYVLRGDTYPGCTSVYSVLDASLKNNEGTYKLSIGDRVYRHMVDGDLMIINRSPTMSLTSVTAIRVVVWKGAQDINQVAFNVTEAGRYNADYDGDMMTGTSPDTEIVREHCALLLTSDENVIDYTNSSPMTGQTQDTIIGCALLTMHDTVLSRSEVLQILNGIEKVGELTKEEYTGREVFSMVMPDIDYYAKCPIFKDPLVEYFGTFDESDKEIVIENGVIKSGIFCSNIIKASKNSIYHVIYFKYGSKTMLEIVFKHQQVIKRFNKIRGITLGYGDIRINKESRELIDLIKSKIYRKYSEFNNRLIEGDIKLPEGVDIVEYVERESLKILNPGEQFLPAILKSINPKENWLFLLVLTKSKGSLTNIYNIFASVGQLKINGKRLPQRLAYKRSSIWEPQFTLNPVSRGYVMNSYNDGLTLPEIQPGGEELTRNILTKNIVTAEGGSLARNIILSIESAVVDNRSFTTRGIGDKIIEFNCGGDGFSGTLTYDNVFPTMTMSDAEIKKLYKDRANLIITDRDMLLNIELSLARINPSYVPSNKFTLPIIMNQIIKKKIGGTDQSKTNSKKYGLLDSFCDDLHYLRYNPVHQKKQTKFPSCMNSMFTLLKIGIRASFTDDIVSTYSEVEFGAILTDIAKYIRSAFYEPGLPIGTILGQSLTSPITQYLIDAHHASTAGGTSRDGLNYSKSVMNNKSLADSKVRTMAVFLKERFETNKENAEKLANYITGKKLSSVVTRTSIIYGELGTYVAESDSEKIIKEFMSENKKINTKEYNKFYIKFVMDKGLMKINKIKIEDVINKIDELFGNKVQILYGKSGLNYLMILYFHNSFNWEYKSSDKKTAGRNASQVDFWDTVKTFIRKTVKNTNINDFGKIREVNVVSKNIYHNVKGEIKKKTIYYVNTVGVDLEQMYLIDVVDKHRTRVNNPSLTYEYEGIIAARDCIISELYNTFNDAIGFNTNHYEMLVNVMIEPGYVTAISEIGHREREPRDLLIRTCMKDAKKPLMEGSLNNTTNQMSSPVAHFILGQDPKNIGTNLNWVTTYDAPSINTDIHQFI